MTMKLLVIRAIPDNISPREFRMAVHLDEAQVQADGSPDPRYVLRLSWTYNSVTDGNKVAYITRITAEAKRQAIAKLAELQAQDSDGTALAGEGGAF